MNQGAPVLRSERVRAHTIVAHEHPLWDVAEHEDLERQAAVLMSGLRCRSACRPTLLGVQPSVYQIPGRRRQRVRLAYSA